MENAKDSRKKQKEREQEEEDEEESKPKPNPALMQGAALPQKMSNFPPELFGIPIEDIDEFYENKCVSFYALICIESA